MKDSAVLTCSLSTNTCRTDSLLILHGHFALKHPRSIGQTRLVEAAFYQPAACGSHSSVQLNLRSPHSQWPNCALAFGRAESYFRTISCNVHVHTQLFSVAVEFSRFIEAYIGIYSEFKNMPRTMLCQVLYKAPDISVSWRHLNCLI